MTERIKFSVEPGLNISLNEISNSPVHDRTSHAGNLSKTSQQLLTVTDNAVILMFSGNKGSDETYTPMYADDGNQKIKIGSDAENTEKLTPFIRVNPEAISESVEQFSTPQLKEVKSVAQFHLTSAQEVWGQNKVQSNYDIFTTQIGKVVLKALSEIPGSCNRVLNTEGILESAQVPVGNHEALIKTVDCIAAASTLGENPIVVAGPVLSNESFLVAHAFIRALPFIQDGINEIDIIHSSGPAMIKYTQKEGFQMEVQRISQALAEKLQLEDVSISEQVFPASDLKMSVPDTEEARDAFEKFSIMIELIYALQGDGEVKNNNILSLSQKYNLNLEGSLKLTKEAIRVVNKMGSELNTDFPKVSGLNFEPRQHTQYTMLSDSRKPPILPRVFSNMNIQQIRFFTELAKQLKNGSSVIPKNLPENLI